MEILLFIFLIFHIVSGFIALLAGGIASLTQKGGLKHRTAGRWYFGSMTGVFGTAVAISALKGLAFLFMVGFFSYYLVVRGYRVLYLKRLGKSQKAAPLDWAISIIAMLFGVGLVAWAITQKISGSSFWPVPLVFGATAAGFSLADFFRYVRGPKHQHHWLTGHIASMGGGYIATWTAFVVTNITFLPAVVAWLAPSVIGTFFISASIRRYTVQKRVKLASPASA